MLVSKCIRAAAAAAIVLGLSASAHADPSKTAKHYRIFPATSFASLAKRPLPPPSDMNYYGGPVFSDVKVMTVMWNSNVAQDTQDQVPAFTQALVSSTYLDQMGEYHTQHVKGINGHNGTHQYINRGTYLGQAVLKPHNTATVLTDDDIQTELKRQIRRHHLPPQDSNTLYMIYFPSDITILLDGQASCVVFGAYHFATIDTRRAKPHNIFYSVEPECNSGFDFLTFAASHEFAEATTDNVPTPLVNPDYPQAWNDAQGMEIADKCSDSATLTSLAGSWSVSQFYLNSIEGCSTAATYTSP
ncbi:MAG: hypothetical protein JOZ72_08605 [Alphaproteobacteria bacterium]|nr:hypothetical protein [Alphaproteobacteria bacterium]